MILTLPWKPSGSTSLPMSIRFQPRSSATPICEIRLFPRCWLGMPDRHASEAFDRRHVSTPGPRRADIPTANCWMTSGWERGLRTLADHGLVFELLVWPSQLDQAAGILRKIPELTVVLEHTGLPYAASSLTDWTQALAGFSSAVPSVRLKFPSSDFHTPPGTRHL
jgi:predicted TIM-barrel fold metal-dependent hydrolase